MSYFEWCWNVTLICHWHIIKSYWDVTFKWYIEMSCWNDTLRWHAEMSRLNVILTFWHHWLFETAFVFTVKSLKIIWYFTVALRLVYIITDIKFVIKSGDPGRSELLQGDRAGAAGLVRVWTHAWQHTRCPRHTNHELLPNERWVCSSSP